MALLKKDSDSHHAPRKISQVFKELWTLMLGEKREGKMLDLNIN